MKAEITMNIEGGEIEHITGLLEDCQMTITYGIKE